jgi:hypothetical protein
MPKANMRMTFIGTKYDKYKDGTTKFKGYIVITEATGEIHTLTAEQIVSSMRAGREVVGLEVKAGKLIGSNGNINNYLKEVYRIGRTDFVDDKMPAVILSVDEEKYFVVTFLTDVSHLYLVKNQVVLNAEQVKSLKKSIGVANCKLVQRNGREYISAIKGRFPIHDYPSPYISL